MIKAGRVPSVERIRLLCEALGLDFYLGPRRSVPPEIARALNLNENCSVEDAIREIERVKTWDTEKWAGLLEAMRKQTEAQLETSYREVDRKTFQIIEEFKHANPGHLKNAPLHAVPFAVEVRETGRPQEVEFVEAAVGISLKRPDIAGWAEWKALIGMKSPGDTMAHSINKGDLIVLDRSKTEPVRGTNFVYLVLSGDGLSLRRLHEADGAWWLYSDNTSYPRRRLGGGDWLLGAVAGIPGQDGFSSLTAASRRAASKK